MKKVLFVLSVIVVLGTGLILNEQPYECSFVQAEELTIEEIEEYVAIELDVQEQIAQISAENNLEWFIAYKEIFSNYSSEIFDKPETIYDYFTEEEIYLIQRAVETECYQAGFDAKCNVASVILNRYYSGLFGETIKDIITSPKQFAYGRKKITEDTILAVEYAFEIEDPTNGAIGFHSNKKTKTFNGWEYVMTDQVGHHFYKIKETK